MIYFLAGLVLFGHTAICIALLNRMHGTGWPRWFLSCLDWVWMTVAGGVPLLIAFTLLRGIVSDVPLTDEPWFRVISTFYVPVTLAGALFGALSVARRVTRDETTPRLISNHTSVINMSERLGEPPVNGVAMHLLARIPGNEILQLSIHEKQLRLPRLDPAWNGFSIAHLSDLHYTGRLSRSFYDEVVRETNAMEPDLIAITGDIIDTLRCIDWIAPTLGQLRARYGVYFVLGNHELRVRDTQRVRRALGDAGLTDASGAWKCIKHAGRPLILAGNELPWYRPVTDLSDVPDTIDGFTPFRLLLAHTPDQLDWARSHSIDLMLAGHTHGGQVRLPWLGPVVAPSLYGVRHASGTFFLEPTLLHVSRGIAGTKPLRYNCLPELAKLVLCAD